MGESLSRSEPTEEELVFNEDFRDGIRLALMRLQQVLDNYSLADGAELSRAYDSYISTMLKICNWNGAFLDGIFKVHEAVKSLADSSKKPREIFTEIKKQFGQIMKREVSDELTSEEMSLRYKLVRVLSLYFHPDSPNVRDLPAKEIERRNLFFKQQVSPAIKDTDGKSLAMLKRIAGEQGLNY
jgi:CRISPR/Cas system-associated protein Cas10 (large subunit of type III CRISPR-Cas system)